METMPRPIRSSARAHLAASIFTVPLMAIVAGCYDTPCPEGRYPDVTVDGAVMYVDAEFGSSAASGLCTDPMDQIGLAVAVLDGPGTVIAASGEYEGDIPSYADLTIYGFSAEDVIVGGDNVGISLREADAVHIQDVTFRGSPFGVWTNGVSQVSLSSVVLSGNSRFGAYFDCGEVTLDGVTVTDNGPGDAGETSGGVQLSGVELARVANSEFRGNAGVGLWGLGSVVQVENTTILDTVLDADGNVGRAMEIASAADGGVSPRLELDGVLVEGFEEAGIVASNARIDGAQVEVRGATGCEAGFRGTGVALSAAHADLAALTVTGACTSGLFSQDDGILVLTDSTVEDTIAGPDGLGVALRLVESEVEVRGSALRGSVGVGVLARCMEELLLQDTTVADVALGEGDAGGDALLAGDSALILDGGAVQGAPRCGVRLVGDSSLDATSVAFETSVGDVCLCDQDPDPTWEDQFVADNTPTPGGTPVVDLDAAGECPAPDPGGC